MQGTLTLKFLANDGAYPADGSDECVADHREPVLLGKFAVGDTFFLDFTPVA
jgi:hypothetical protein